MGLRRRDLPYLALLLGLGLWLDLPGLAHPSLWNWDESIHQAVARGVYDSLFTPHILVEPFYPTAANEWVNAGVWLHKPPLPFWIASAIMHVLGISPLGLRLASLGGMLLAALGIFLFARCLVSRPWALATAASFLALPFGWRMVQGYQFGDVTDCTLVGAVVVAMGLLLRSIEAETRRAALATAAGVAVGLGFLCKSALALTPIGVGLAFALLGSAGLCRGLPWRSLGLMVLAFATVALPWSVACALRWPALNRIENLHTLGHLSGVSVENWIRPADAIFNEIAESELAPLPLALPILAGSWLAVRALRRRETPAILVALWLGSEWVILSAARVKVPAIAWTAVPPLFVALALLCRDAVRRPVLAAVLVGAVATPWIVKALPALERVREFVPKALVETRARPGLAVGLSILVLALLVGLLVARLGSWMGGTLGAAAFAAAAFLFLWQVPRAQAEAKAKLEDQSLLGYMKDVGLALDRGTPKKSVVFLAIDQDPPSGFAVQELIFWSGRMVYRRPPDLATARARGYHPYLVSPTAQPYRELPGVPAASWLRAYDLDARAPPPPPPVGRVPLDARTGALRILGYAVEPGDSRHGHYAFFVHPEGPPGPVPVAFETRTREDLEALMPQFSLDTPWTLAKAPWFIVPILGPPPGELRAVRFPAR